MRRRHPFAVLQSSPYVIKTISTLATTVFRLFGIFAIFCKEVDLGITCPKKHSEAEEVRVLKLPVCIYHSCLTLCAHIPDLVQRVTLGHRGDDICPGLEALPLKQLRAAWGLRRTSQDYLDPIRRLLNVVHSASAQFMLT